MNPSSTDRAMRRLHWPTGWSGEEPIRGPAFHHLARVLRVVPGNQLVLFDGQGMEWPARVVEVGRDSMVLELGSCRPAAVAATSSRVALLAGLTRGAQFDRVVREATELGVSDLVPVITTRTVPELRRDRADSRAARWQRITSEAARQCGRADLPLIWPLRSLAEVLAQLDWPERLVGQPGGGTNPAPAWTPPTRVAVLIGPEGGLTTAESALAQDHGFRPFSMGPRTLRAETAAVVAVALVLHWLGELG